VKETKDITVCVIDHGLFLPVAFRMAEECKRVLYHTPCEKAFATLNDHIIGDGFSEIERCEDFWKIKNEVDLWIFPDIQHSGLQLELESQGFAVWGSRNADSLEINREKFHRVLKEVGLPVPKYEVIKGLGNLRVFLKDKTDRYIKISKYRGTMETTHWRDYDLDSGWLDGMAVKLGPAQDLLKFLVFEPIDTPVEVGGDTYCVDGNWPGIMLHGDEEKDKSYLGAVTPFNEMPKELQDIMLAFSPILAKDRYRNQWSMETRDGRFTDATCRGGLPSTGSQLYTWKNFPDIVWHGANGELVEPEPRYMFSAESILNLKGKKEEWGKIRLPDELWQHALLAGCCEIDGAICFPSDGSGDSEVGWLQAGGDTPEEAIEGLKELEKILPEGMSTELHCFIDLLDGIKKAEKEGIPFGEGGVPDPAMMVEK
jgi:hypothetical protein